MHELINAINLIGSPFNMIVWIVLICSIAGVFSALAKEIRKYGCHRQDIDFKRELVDRGLSAEEVERIVASQPADRKDPPANVAGNYYAEKAAAEA